MVLGFSSFGLRGAFACDHHLPCRGGLVQEELEAAAIFTSMKLNISLWIVRLAGYPTFRRAPILYPYTGEHVATIAALHFELKLRTQKGFLVVYNCRQFGLIAHSSAGASLLHRSKVTASRTVKCLRNESVIDSKLSREGKNPSFGKEKPGSSEIAKNPGSSV